VTGEARVLVTGAAGFLGTRVCDTMARSSWQVRAMVHRKTVPHTGCDIIEADLTEPGSLRRAVEGVDAIVHLAARVHVMRETASDALHAYRAVNVEGTRSLLTAARDAGVSRFLLISSVKAVAESSLTPLTSCSEPSPGDAYGVSKLEAERLVVGADSAELRTSILRLPLVYGPGMRGNMFRLFQLIDRGIPLPLGNITNARSIVYADNVAAAISHMLASTTLTRGPFFVSDLEDISTSNLIRAIAEALGRPDRLISLPPWLLHTIRRAGVSATEWGMPDPSPALDRLLTSLRVDGTEIQKATGFLPPFTTRRGLSNTAAWFKAWSHAQ
jgi:nucleoside-diphosphate-sugar epimerase